MTKTDQYIVVYDFGVLEDSQGNALMFSTAEEAATRGVSPVWGGTVKRLQSAEDSR